MEAKLMTAVQADLLVLELQKANVQPQHACEVVAAAHHALSSGRQQLLSMSPEWSQRLRLEAATAAAGTMAALITKVQQALRDSSARQQLVTALQSSLGPESLAGKAAGMQQQVLYVARHLLEACQSDVLLLLGAIMLADMMAPGWARGLLSGSGQQRVTLTWLVEQYLADAEVALACSQHLPLQDLVLQLQLHAASKELSQVAAAASVKHCEGMLYVFKRLGLSVQQLESVQQDSAAEAEGSTAAPVEPAMQSSSSAAAMAKPLSAAAAVFVPAAGTMEQHVCSHVTAAVGLAERWASEADVAAGHGFPDTYSGHIAGALAVGKEAASSRQAELQPLFKTVSQLVAEAPRGGQDEAASAISHSSSSSSTATKAPEATPATRPGSSPSGRGSAPRRADSAESLEAALHLAVCNAAACSKTLAHAAASGGQLDAAGGQSVAEGLGGGLVATVNAVKQALAAATAARQALPRKTPALVFLGEALQRMDAVQPYLAQARQIVSQGGSGSEARSRQADLICEVQEELEYCVQAALLMRSLPLDPLDIKYLLAHHAQSSTGLALTAAQLGPRVPGSPLPSEFSTTEVVAWLLRLPGDEGWFHLLGIIKEDAKLLQQYAAAAVAAAAAGFILLLDTTGAERLTDEVKRELLMRAYTAHHYQRLGLAQAVCSLVGSYHLDQIEVQQLKEALEGMAADPSSSPAVQRRAAALLACSTVLLQQLHAEGAITEELMDLLNQHSEELPDLAALDELDRAHALVEGVRELEERHKGSGANSDQRAAFGRAGARWRAATLHSMLVVAVTVSSQPETRRLRRAMARVIDRALAMFQSPSKVWPEYGVVSAVLGSVNSLEVSPGDVAAISGVMGQHMGAAALAHAAKAAEALAAVMPRLH